MRIMYNYGYLSNFDGGSPYRWLEREYLQIENSLLQMLEVETR